MKHNPGFLALVEETRSRVSELTVGQYGALVDGGTPHVLIDVREESEWAAGRAAGAEHLGKGILERDIESRVPDRSTTVVLYCGGGYRSVLAADAMQRMGYTSVHSLAGGWRAWNEANRPVEK
jgi:rhodanese-related sulfurtransferase